MNRGGLLRISGLLVLPLIAGLALPPLLADDEVGQAPPPGQAVRAAAAAAQAGKSADGKPAARFPDIADATKGMDAAEGLFTLYRYPSTDKEHDLETLLARIPRNLLGQDLLLATSLSRGRMAGWTWGSTLVRLEIAGQQLKLVTPDLRFARKQGRPVNDVVERTYNDTFLTAVPIAGMSPQGDVLIDLGQLLKSDLADVQRLGGRVRPELSTWAKVKAFPDNVLIDADLALGEQRGGRKVGVTYNFRRLPPLGAYTPRRADPRVGYFLTAQLDWGKKPHERELFDRYIHRWHLEKQDPSLKLSPPKKPIVFIIEKTVPIQWRRWVREGILEWNKAFEQIGYVDAIIVQQQTDDNEYADYDPEDARYNFFRWIVSGQSFAAAPSRVDPRTGQILDSDIIFDDSFARAWMYDFDLYGPTAMARFKGPDFQRWLEENPELAEGLWPAGAASAPGFDGDAQMWSALEQKLHEEGTCTCQYAWGMQHELAVVQHAMIATGTGPKKLPERFIGGAIRQIVTHEVGHSLGLRHNFQGSYWLSMDEIKQRRNETDEPTTASIMDYTPLLFFADDEVETVRHFVTPTIGPYDHWAIEYGYASPQGQSEEDMLQAMARRGAEPALNYATDEDTRWIYSPDPRVNRYDLSSNPIDYARARIALTDKLLGSITEWALQDGEPRHYLTRAFENIFFERIRSLSYVPRIVTGQYFNRDHHGDPGARPAFELLDPALPRQALAFLGETAFNAEFFHVDPATLNMLAPTRWTHWGSDAPTRLDYPIRDRIQIAQVSTLMNLLAAPALQRVYDAELRSTAEDKFTAAEMVRTVRDTVWKELDGSAPGPFTDAQPFIGSLERNLQRDHLFAMLSYLRGRPGATVSKDLHAILALAMRELHEKIAHNLDSRELDFASRAHLEECRSRIERTLTAQFQAQ